MKNTMRSGVYDAKDLVQILDQTFKKEITLFAEKNDDFKSYYYSSEAIATLHPEVMRLFTSIVNFYDEVENLGVITPRVVDDFRKIRIDIDNAYSNKSKNNDYFIIRKLQNDLVHADVAWQYKRFCREAIEKLEKNNLSDNFPETMSLLKTGSEIEFKE